MQINYRKTKPLVHYGILGFMYAIGLVTLFSHTVLHAMEHEHHEEPAASVALCEGEFKQYQFIFTDSGVMPEKITVKQCDKIVVQNNTSNEIEPAIGSHPHHIHYPGFEEKTISTGETYAFRAVQAGTFLVHDHDEPSLSGVLVVDK